jgi:glycosyltransferase involved in cell wall biosynthesis
MDVIEATRIIRVEEPDVFHSHFYPADVCGALCASITPHLMHCHGTTFRPGRPILKVAADFFRAKAGEITGLMRCREAIAISDFIRESIERTVLPKRLPRITTVYNGVDLSRFQDVSRGSTREIIRTKWETPILLNVGALSARKGQRALIEAAAKLKHNGRKFSLLLVGRIGAENPGYEQELSELASSLNVSDKVFFLGEVKESSITELFLGSDLFVTGTQWEGFGLPLIEAFASGLPVVCFGNSALNELVDDGATGFKALDGNSVDLANKVDVLLTNEKLRAKMAANAVEIARSRFSIERACSQIAEIYGRIAKC